ncbi:MAG: branched-chain amino acid transport system II carrier protein [Brevinema sp.]
MQQRNEMLISGVALFAMFFGAGNLIFPSFLGFYSGEAWFPAALGFLITGVGMPLLGMISFSQARGIENFANKVSKKFNVIYVTILAIIIGPLFAVPRTASTTFELAIVPIIGEASFGAAIITSLVFFGITYYLCIKESNIVDVIGKYLTPIIVICLVVIGYLGITGNIGMPGASESNNNFYYGFTQGYQTMDALASVLFGVIILKDMISKGFKEPNQQKNILLGAGFIAAIGLSSVYFLLIFLGSRISTQPSGSTTSSVIITLVEMILGKYGKIFFGLCVGAACLTTAVGTVAFVSEWFSKISKMSYKFWLAIISLLSFGMSVGGVDFLIKLSVPFLFLLYPVTLVLILLNLMAIKNHWYYKVAVTVTIIISTIDILAMNFNLSIFQHIVQFIPLGKMGFVWIVPFILSLCIVFITEKVCSPKKIANKKESV